MDKLSHFSFAVAISFAGEQREWVEQLDALLRDRFPIEKIFYDLRYEDYMEGPDLDLKLSRVYHDQSEVVVACLSEAYARKHWTGYEGRAIRDLMLRGRSDHIVLIRFDDTPVEGIYEISGYLDARVVPIAIIVNHIVERQRFVTSQSLSTYPTYVARPKNLPFASLGTLFKGRTEFLSDLHDRFRKTPDRATAIIQKQAIHGLGGVGKTRLAIEYGHHYEHEYSALLFVMAETPTLLHSQLASLCGPMVLNLPEQGAPKEEQQLAGVLRWLAMHPGWLLIIDNADTEDAAVAVELLLPQLRGGHILITSRLRVWSGSVESLELDVLSDAASVAFLLERTQNTRLVAESDESEARALAKDAGNLALAMEQASAYIAAKRITIADYRLRWRQGTCRCGNGSISG